MTLHDHALHVHQVAFEAPAPVIGFAPGRVNLIGEHTDYNDGFVLPMPLAHGTAVALRPRADAQIRLYAKRGGARAEERLDAGLAERVEAAPVAWSSYVLGMAAVLYEYGLIDCGFEATIVGDLPVGAGLSSSASLEMAVGLALQGAFGFELEGAAMARLGQHVEHRFAGVQCGIMDQFASRLGHQGHALFLDCRSLAYEAIPVASDEVMLMIVFSRAPRDLAGSAYNERRASCEAAVAHFQQHDANIRALRDVSMTLFEAEGQALPRIVQQRVRHVLTENQRVLDSVAALRSGDFRALGARFNASHASMRDDYAISSPHLDQLIASAHAVDGCYGARLTGAGFGGCTVNLIQRRAAEAFVERVGRDYRQAFGIEPLFVALESGAEADFVRV
ncbi:MAG: galactokinase [Rhodothermales bacterium]